MITSDQLTGPKSATHRFWTGPETRMTIEMWERAMEEAHVSTARTADWLHNQCGPLIGAFGSARGPDKAIEAHRLYGALADNIGKRLGEEGFALITGGCPGMPQRVEVGLRNHRVSARHQPVIGIRIMLGNAQSFEPDSPTCDAMLKTGEFYSRIGLMEYSTEGGIFLPGGWGTTLELGQFGQIEQLRGLMGKNRGGPIILAGTEYWAKHQGFTQAMIDRWCTLTDGEIRITVTDDPEEIVQILKDHNGNELRAARIKNGTATTTTSTSRSA